MNSVQELLKSLGPPPGEICIDWAWQLYDLAELGGGLKESEEAMPTGHVETKKMDRPDAAYRQLTWEEVIVDSHGRLKICPLPNSVPKLTSRTKQSAWQHWKADALMTELLAWTGREASPSDRLSLAALMAATKRLAMTAGASSESETGRKWSRNAGQIQRFESEGTETERSSSVSEGPAPMRLAMASTESEAANAAQRSLDPSSDPTQARTSRKRETAVPQRLLRTITRSRGRLLVTIAVPALLIFGLGGLFQLGWFGSHSTADGSSDPALGLSEKSADALDGDPMALLGEGSPTAMAEGGVEELSLLADLDLRERDQNGVPSSDSESDRSIDALSELDQLATSPIQLSPGETIGTPTLQPLGLDGSATREDSQAKNIARDTADGASPPLDALEGVETIDVISELAAVTRESEAAQTETSLKAEDTELSSDSQRAAFSINTFPMIQVLRLPLASVPRTKQPAWKLKLAVSEGFAIEPSEPIEIREGSVGGWTIVAKRDEESNNLTAQPEKTESRIVVQVQQTGKRGNSLRWRVAIVTEELPQVTLPMGQQYLDALQANLAQVTARLQSGIAQFRALSATSGLPSNFRSQVFAQRKLFEAQLELVSRLRSVTADANQMDGWLDGQIEVHAQFFDLASSDSTPLLQFGAFPAINHE